MKKGSERFYLAQLPFGLLNKETYEFKIKKKIKMGVD